MSRQHSYPLQRGSTVLVLLILLACTVAFGQPAAKGSDSSPRQRISINEDWRFMKYNTQQEADDLIYDVRPKVKDDQDGRPADAKPTEAVDVEVTQRVLKPWILPGRAGYSNPQWRLLKIRQSKLQE